MSWTRIQQRFKPRESQICSKGQLCSRTIWLNIEIFAFCVDINITSCLKYGIKFSKKAWFAGCAQTLSNATPPIGRIQLLSKITVACELMMQFWCPLKLDVVGPVDNRPSTNKFHNFVRKKNKIYIYIWHVTRDMWHVTRDMWHVTGGRKCTFSQNFSSLALLAWEWRFVEYLEEKDDSLT